MNASMQMQIHGVMMISPARDELARVALALNAQGLRKSRETFYSDGIAGAVREKVAKGGVAANRSFTFKNRVAAATTVFCGKGDLEITAAAVDVIG